MQQTTAVGRDKKGGVRTVAALAAGGRGHRKVLAEVLDVLPQVIDPHAPNLLRHFLRDDVVLEHAGHVDAGGAGDLAADLDVVGGGGDEDGLGGAALHRLEDAFEVGAVCARASREQKAD